MYQKKKIAMMLIIALLFQLVLPIIESKKVVAFESINYEEKSTDIIETDSEKTNVDTNLETIKFGSYSNENIEKATEEVVKETSTVLENTENISEAYLEWSELSDEKKKNTVEPRKEYIDISELQTNEQFVTSGVTIPERYNLRDVLSEIKTESQGSNGNCYAFAGLNAVETNIALKTGTIYDFSEMHIEYMTSTLLGGSRTFNAGGNFQTVIKYSDDLQGPVLESEIANKNYTEDEYSLLKNAKPIVSITETIEFPTINKRYGYTEEELTEFRESVKSHIMENGSVYASIYFSESSNYYNSTTKGYSCLDTSVLTNHAVSIIGWDDSYSKDNFPSANRPTKDGAWIALNSHGSSFGDNGVFYISYEDNWVEYNMSGVVSTTSFVDTYGPKVELTNYTNDNNSISATINVFDIGGNGVNTSSLKYQWTQSSEQPTLESFTTSFTNGDTLSKTYGDGEQWYLWILAYDTEDNYSISGAVQELKFTDENFYNALCYILSDRIISSKVNEDSTYSIFMTQDTIENITSLSLSAVFDYPLPNHSVNDEIKNIEGIEQFFNLKTLRVYSENITNIDNISFPSGLENLIVSGSKLTSINNVVLPSGLKLLDLHQNFNLIEINIELPKSIEELNLYGLSALENWESINFPDNLKKLNLASCNLGDKIESLNLPITLTELLIGDNGITNIDCLNNLTNLEKLCISANNISDISVIENFSKLVNFKAGDTYSVDFVGVSYYGTQMNQISDINNIDFPNTIESLDLGYNKITDVSSVNWPTSLKSLYLDNNLIENIEIDMGQHFSYINLSYNKIKDVSKINISSEWTSYGRMINLSDNEIQSIPTESWGQSKVGTLILSNNNISNIDNVVWPEELDSLAIDGNNITVINGITWKDNLRYLILNYNNISEIKNVTWPASLQAIEVEKNNITDLSWIESGINLRGIALNNNKIKNIESLSVLSKLQELHLDSNYVDNISALDALTNLGSLHIKKQSIIKVVENDVNNSELPQIIQQTMISGSKVYTENEMILRNCEYEEGSIQYNIDNLGYIFASVSGGVADGTTIFVTNSENQEILKDVYAIHNKEDLINVTYVNNCIHFDLSNSKIELMNDIDLGGNYNEETGSWEGETWIPIGTKEAPFEGFFEGNGFTITGLYINTDQNYQGIIGYNQGTIQNITVEGYIQSTGSYVGGICGYNVGTSEDYKKIPTIRNAKSNVQIESTGQFTGGICGKNATALIEDCYNVGKITGGNDTGGIVGGNTVGFSSPYYETTGVVSKCYNTGEVNGEYEVGGICGTNSLMINYHGRNCVVIDCYNIGNVFGSCWVGGIVGKASDCSKVENCYNLGNVCRISNYQSNVGNIIGTSYGITQNCYYPNTSNIKAINNKDDEENKVYALSTLYMKTSEFVSLLNRDREENVWKLEEGMYKYPVLEWQTTYPNFTDDEESIWLTKIAVTKTPTKTTYIEGQNFNPEGMKVTATYNDGTTKEVTNYTVTDGNNLTTGKTSVTISYTENGVTKTTTQGITVTEKLQIEIEYYTENKEENDIYIEDVSPNTTIENMTSKIYTNGQIEIFKGTEKITNVDTKLATGMTLKISLNNEQVEYTIAVTGDLNGDGEMGDIDVLRFARYRAGLDKSLTGAYLRASNIFKDDNYADDIDLLKMVRILVGLDSLD